MKRVVCVGIAASLLFLLLFHWSKFAYIGVPWGHHDDENYYYFMVQNSVTKLLSGDIAHLYDSRMFYPFRQTGALGNSGIGQGLLTIPWYLATGDIVTGANLMLLTNFFLAYVGTYLLVYMLTGSVVGALMGGLIYTYNSYVLAIFPHNFDIITIQWLPLLFLAAEWVLRRALASQSIRVGTMIVGILFLWQLVSSVYYVIFLVPLFLIYFGVRLWQKRIGIARFVDPWVIGIFVVTVIASIWLFWPFLQMHYRNKVGWDQNYLRYVSAVPSDYLFTLPTNKIWGSIASSDWAHRVRPGYSVERAIEHALFPGLIALILSAIAIIFVWRFRKNRDTVIFAWCILLASAFLVSLGVWAGPVWSVTRFFPGFSSIRVFSRCAIFVQLALAVLAGFGWKYIAGRIKGRYATVILGIIFLGGMVVEYQTSFPTPTPIDPMTLAAYTWLTGQKDIRVIVEIPIADGVNRGFIDEEEYLLYALYHDKAIINGSTSVNPPQSIELGRELTVHFPSLETIEGLRSLGAGAVVIHDDEFTDPLVAHRVRAVLNGLNIPEVFTSGNVHIFRL